MTGIVVGVDGSESATSPTLGPQHLAQVDRNGLEVLSRGECLQLLGGATLGRIGITIQALPLILPVNFKLVGHAIVFRTGPGTKLDAATRGSVVAFEADEIEPFSHAGWSVVVTGVAQEVTRRDASLSSPWSGSRDGRPQPGISSSRCPPR